MPDALKPIVIELTGLALLIVGAKLLLAGDLFGWAAFTTGRRWLVRPSEPDTCIDRVVELLTHRGHGSP